MKTQMRYSADHKNETRARILDAAARRFRAEGYDGLGIDGLAKAAGVTNGAFYGHFATKADAFREVIATGLRGLKEGIHSRQSIDSPHWLSAFARYYFSEAKIARPENTCVLPSFAPEMSRAPEETRAAFQEGLLAVREAVASGLAAGDAQQRDGQAWVALALLVGGVTLARSVSDPAVSSEIVEALTGALDAMAHSAASPK